MLRRIPTSKGGTLILALFAVLAIVTSTGAQSDDPGCALCAGGTDSGCIDLDNCASLTGCSSYHFKPVCSGQYTLSAWTTCTPGNCAHCAVCVSVYDAMPPYQLIGQCETTGAQYCQQGTAEDCDRSCSISLSGGKPYVMSVCLIACPTEVEGCEGCGEDDGCVAHGCVFNNSGSCCQ